MRITLLKNMFGPQGTAYSGVVLDLPEDQANALVRIGAARPFDKMKDKHAPVGMSRTRNDGRPAVVEGED